jgi:hypothetical protein
LHDRRPLRLEPAGGSAFARTVMGEATLTGHLPGQGVEQVASQSYVPPDAKDDKALATALDLLHGGRTRSSR